ncbi:glycosyltransferase family 87 protein [Geodermatophilus sp. URMC 64]
MAAVAAVAWFVVFHVSQRPVWHDFFDLRVYRGSVEWWFADRPLYDFRLDDTRYGFTYPLFALLVMVPLALVPLPVAVAVVLTAGLVAVALIAAVLLVPVARRHGWPPAFTVALAVPVVLALEPIRETLGYGQINMLILGLVLADLVALQRGRPWAGVGIGLAAALKVAPGLFVLYLLLTRRLRPAATAIGTFLAATLVGFLADGRASWTYWTADLWDDSRVGPVSKQTNQSVLGVLARATATDEPNRLLWAVLAAGILVLALRRAVRACRAGDELVGFTLVGLASCAISPITWTHHLYWVLPAVVVLVDVAAGTPVLGVAPARERPVRFGAGLGALAVVLAFGLSVMWFGVEGVPGQGYRQGLLGVLSDDVYAAIVLVLLALLPVRRLSGSAAPSAARTTAPPRPAGSSPR